LLGDLVITEYRGALITSPVFTSAAGSPPHRAVSTKPDPRLDRRPSPSRRTREPGVVASTGIGRQLLGQHGRLPYWSVSDFSRRRSWATPSAIGRCSTLAGTTNNSGAQQHPGSSPGADPREWRRDGVAAQWSKGDQLSPRIAGPSALCRRGKPDSDPDPGWESIACRKARPPALLGRGSSAHGHDSRRAHRHCPRGLLGAASVEDSAHGVQCG